MRERELQGYLEQAGQSFVVQTLGGKTFSAVGRVEPYYTSHNTIEGSGLERLRERQGNLFRYIGSLACRLEQLPTYGTYLTDKAGAVYRLLGGEVIGGRNRPLYVTARLQRVENKVEETMSGTRRA